MISGIKIRNFIIVDEIAIDFGNKFTAITGETGAGKSIIIDCINFCFGMGGLRAVKKNIQQDTIVELAFDIDDSKKDFINQTIGLDIGNRFTLRRVFASGDKAKTYINNEPSGSKIARQLMPTIVRISDQFDTILDNKKHQSLLDSFMFSEISDSRNLFNEVNSKYSDIKNLEHNLLIKINEIDSAIRDKEYNNQIISEFENLDIDDNEELTLITKRQSLANKNNSKKLLIESLACLDGNLESKLNQAIKIILKSESEDIRKYGERLDSVYFELKDIINELESHNRSIESLEAEIEGIDDRLSIVRALARKYNISANLLGTFFAKAKQLIVGLDDLEKEKQELQKQLTESKKEYQILAKDLNLKRSSAAAKLTREVSKNLSDLLLSNATFEIKCDYVESKISETGSDDVEFLANFNKSDDLKNLKEVASGGEATRLNFAMHLALAKSYKVETMIFDEIDIGIGGAAAFAMGKAMNNLASSGIQVISITHSPQVSATANDHIVVKKKISHEDVSVDFKKLEDAERVQEIARMLSGENILDEAIETAKKLING